MHKVSVREISRATGFSPATVSNALNHKRNVSEETAEKIRAAAKAMGYQHPSQLDAITFVLARKTGAIVDESTFHPSVIEGVERQARRHGMGTAFVSLDFSDLDAVRPQVAALVSDPSAAIVLLGTELGEEDYELFRDSAARLVVLDGWSDRFDFDAVVMANEGSALRAVRYLTERGHKKIGYLSGDFRIQNFRARERGFFRALDEAGLGFDPLWRIELGTTLERIAVPDDVLGKLEGKRCRPGKRVVLRYAKHQRAVRSAGKHLGRHARLVRLTTGAERAVGERLCRDVGKRFVDTGRHSGMPRLVDNEHEHAVIGHGNGCVVRKRPLDMLFCPR